MNEIQLFHLREGQLVFLGACSKLKVVQFHLVTKNNNTMLTHVMQYVVHLTNVPPKACINICFLKNRLSSRNVLLYVKTFKANFHLILQPTHTISTYPIHPYAPHSSYYHVSLFVLLLILTPIFSFSLQVQQEMQYL